MAYPYQLVFTAGEAGLTLTASVVNRAGTALASQPAYTIVDDGGGNYAYYTDAMPDGQQGRVKILNGATVVVTGLVEPREVENADVRSSLLLGLLHSNWVLRDPVFTDNQLVSATIRIYDTAAHATTDDGVTGLLGEWDQVVTYNGALLSKATQTRVS